MARTTRLLLLLAAVAFVVAACGVDAGKDTSASPDDGATTSTPEPDDESTAPDEPTGAPDPTVPDEAVDALVDVYVEFGFSEDEATCLAEQLADAGDSVDPNDTGALMDVINQCDIPLSRLTELTEDLGGTMEEGMQASLEAGLRAAGLDASQAECVASGFIDAYGADTSGANDPSVLAPLFEACDVDPSMLGD